MFALEYCGSPPYDVDKICRCLEVNDEGIAFRQIRDILQSHGLFAAVREGVGVADLADYLGPGQLAILPIRFPETGNHYIIIVKHRTKGLLLVDPPQSVTRLDEYPSLKDKLAELRKPLKSAALFVRGDEKSLRAAGNPQPKVAPAVLNLGPITIKASSATKPLSCEVTNTGDRAMMVSGVRLPCGCMSADWSAAVVPARGAKTLTLTVDLDKWGPPDGSVPSKDVYLDILGQPPLKLTVAAEVNNEAKGFRRLVDENIHRFRLVDSAPASLRAVSMLSANAPILPEDYTVVAPAWVQADVEAVSPPPAPHGLYAVRVAFTLIPSKLPPLDAGDVLDDGVRIEDNKRQLVDTIRVVVDRTFALDFPTLPITLHASNPKPYEVAVSAPAGRDIDPSQIEVLGDSSVNARVIACDAAARRLRCSLETSAVPSRPEYHAVNFNYKTAVGPVRARLRVLVVP